MNIKQALRIDGVKPAAIQNARALLDTANSVTPLPEPDEIAADGLGGLEISWKEGLCKVLFSVAMSRDDIPPDAYVMFFNGAETEREKRYRTFRKNLDEVLLNGIMWLEEESETK